MAKKGNTSKQNLRQRKKKEEGPSDKDDEDLDALLKETKSKSSGIINWIPILVVVVLVAVLVGLAVMPAEEDQAKNNKTSKKQAKKDPPNKEKPTKQNERKLQDDAGNGDTTFATFVTDYKVLRTLPHDTSSFTQGLTFRPDNSSIVYEATGMYKESVVRILDLDNNGEVLKQYDTADQYFGEGLAYFRDESKPDDKGRMIHITWKEQTGFVFDMDSLEVLEEFNYTSTTNEGWGIIHVPGENIFIMSDGSEYLHFWDMNYQEVRPKVKVTFSAPGRPQQDVKYLNELEWDPATKTVLANVWYQNIILRIDPTTGHVLTVYDLSTLYTDREPKSDVFNGIALSATGELWVTGKYWPTLYQIELGEPA